MGLTFGILGPLEVWRDACRVAVASAKQRSLLVALLLRAGQVVPAAELIDCVWGEQPPADPAAALQMQVSRLRRLLAGPQPEVGPALLAAAPGGYVLRVPPADLDLRRFERLAEQGRELLPEDPAAAVDKLRAALALWRGPALADVASWRLRRTLGLRLAEARLAALEDRIDAELRLGRHVSIVGELRELVAGQPQRERLRAQLMLALYRAGRQTEALEVYRDTRRMLVADLGLDPSPELERLQRAILRRERSLELPAEARQEVPGGAADGSGGTPVLAGPAVLPAQLPVDVAQFTGRVEALHHLDALLDGGEGRAAPVVISVITGTAGVGKSALAVHWAHQVRERFPGGQLFVNLHGYGRSPPLRPLQALTQLLGALGVEPDRVPAELDAAAGLYRSLLSGRRTLIVLDNARNAEQVRPLLPGSPGAVVLITSRDRLAGLVASHGAQRLTLEMLAPDDAVRLLARILGERRVGAEPRAAAELAAICGYLPLALRIAAANLASHDDQPLRSYVARLRRGDPLAELAVDGDPESAVRTAFDCSYAALDQQDQRLFRLLGLVPARDFGAAAAAALAGSPLDTAERALRRLAAGHLLEGRAPGRFGLHDLLRLYAHQRAERDEPERERQQAAKRLLAWYLDAADAADRLRYPQIIRLPVPRGPAGLPPTGFGADTTALAWLDTEHPNLVAAVEHVAEQGPARFAWLLADALRNYFWGSRRMADWLAVADAAVRAAAREGDAQAQAAARRNLGLVHQCLGDYERAAEQHASALTLARQAGWVDGEAAALAALGRVHTELGRPERGAEHYERALALHRQLGSKAGQAVTLSNLGDVNRLLGRPRQAVEQLTHALALYQELGIGSPEGILCTLGEACRDLGEVDAAREHLDQALERAREAGNRYVDAGARSALAALHHDAGRQAAALELAETALAVAREIGDPRLQSEALTTMGGIRLCLDRPSEALRHQQEALELARQAGARFPEAAALLGLAATYQRLGQASRTVQHAEQALGIARTGRFRILEGRAHRILAAANTSPTAS